MQIYPNTYYMTVTEKLRDKEGNFSIYNRISGNGQFTAGVGSDIYVKTKADLKERVEKILERHIDLENYNIKETDYGWEYEMFVKWLDEDGMEFEIVDEGQHTDHELYTVDISYYTEDWDAFKKLK